MDTPIYVTADVHSLEDGSYEVVAYAEKEYRITAATEAQAKEDFLSMWNETHDKQYEMGNVDFVLRDAAPGE